MVGHEARKYIQSALYSCRKGAHTFNDFAVTQRNLPTLASEPLHMLTQ